MSSSGRICSSRARTNAFGGVSGPKWTVSAVTRASMLSITVSSAKVIISSLVRK